tara:strand:- start:19789 stop:20712 length:924 start_codon:yes stop_codon:yes gene_type:complete
MENLNLLLKRLLDAKIDFVLIGGYAAVVHGASQVTHDLDICAVITEEQLVKLKAALKGLDPKHRMNPSAQLSLDDFPAEGKTIDNYYLRTTAGVLDILKEVSIVGDFEKLKSNANTVKIFGHECKVISLDDLITVKKSMTRPKDKSVLDELLTVKQKLSIDSESFLKTIKANSISFSAVKVIDENHFESRVIFKDSKNESLNFEVAISKEDLRNFAERLKSFPKDSHDYLEVILKSLKSEKIGLSVKVVDSSGRCEFKLELKEVKKIELGMKFSNTILAEPLKLNKLGQSIESWLNHPSGNFLFSLK